MTAFRTFNASNNSITRLLYKSPMQSKILINKFFLFLNPPGFKSSLSFTTRAFSRLPPLANPIFLIDSISSCKQNVLELKISVKSYSYTLTLFL